MSIWGNGFRNLPWNPQHAHQVGKSTETALHYPIIKIVRSIQEKQYALTLILDIERHLI